MQKIRLLPLLLMLLLFGAGLLLTCKNENSGHQKSKPLSNKELEEKFMEMNKYLLAKDSERVVNYIERRKWDMQLTTSGFWYQIYEQGNGQPVTEGDVVRFNYRIELLDGTLCYTSDSTGAKTFEVGHGGVEYGLEKGILLLQEGDKARFILLPYHAHGLLGDRKRIPPHSTIMYQLHLLDVKSGPPGKDQSRAKDLKNGR